MERLAQLLDDFDDLISTVGLLAERLRHLLLVIIATSVTVAVQVGGVWLALVHPPLALAVAMILFVSLLYYSVTAARYEIALK